MRRALALALAAVALAGCDVVTSKTAVFGPADAAKAQPKPGLWAVVNGDCAFDESRPVDAWPEKCVLPVAMRQTDLLMFEREKGKPAHWNQASYLLAGGDPLIMQTFTSEGAEFDFYTVSVDRLDGDGRIVAAHVRQITCGPAAKPDGSQSSDKPQPAGSENTRQTPLYPGLIATGRTGCTPKDADGLRMAAKAGAGDGSDMPAHWVRDGWR
jgi:hypothetical protein